MNRDYLHSFNFVVRINAFNIGFQKVSGLGQQVEVETYQEGGQNSQVHIFPQAMKDAGTLRLERGMTLFQPGLLFLPGEWVPLIFIEVKNLKTNEICKTYSIIDAVVKKWEIGELNAQENKLLIETFEISYGQIYVI